MSPADISREETDRRFMQIALAMARRGLGTTAPNPSVGAVIVDERTGEIVARGWTQHGGRPHAETEALRRAGDGARGASMFVTLEPCSHYGKTAPCADAIIAAGIGRVVTGILDPDPRVAGRGLDALRAAGVEVRRGVCAQDAAYLTLGHISRVTERRPFVQIKMALGADGSVPHGRAGTPVWVTSPLARAHAHLLRARTDAILVGAGTVVDDDPQLTCRLPGLQQRSPIRAVLCANRLPGLGSKLVHTARDHPVYIFCPASTPASSLAALEAAGCRTRRVSAVGGRLWIPAVLEALVVEGVTRLLVEGGPTVWRSFLASGLVDEVVQYVGNAGPAGDGLSAGLDTLQRFGGHMTFTRVDERPIADDRLIVYHRARGR